LDDPQLRKASNHDTNASLTMNTLHLGGTIRLFPSDFIVEEVWKTRICTIHNSLLTRIKDQWFRYFSREKDYLHFTLVKTDWETIRALNYIRRKLRVSLKRFGIAGMKDKRAVTGQRVSVWNVKVEQLARFRFKDIYLKDFEYADDRITLGNALGNRFTITIRDIPKTIKETMEIIQRFRAIITSSGIPNYFGSQRFGSGNANVGQAIKEGDLKRGVEIILKKTQPYLQAGGIERIPKVFWYEKKMLRHLTKYPNDYAGALRQIPKKILTLYVHAYQSRLFNNQLQHALTDNSIPETIDVAGFHVSKMPELRAFPLRRRTLLTSPNFQMLKHVEGMVVLRFTLAKGEYASTLLSQLRTIPTRR
jgi:TruD family tRNA pseudouridine synthase